LFEPAFLATVSPAAQLLEHPDYRRIVFFEPSNRKKVHKIVVQSMNIRVLRSQTHSQISFRVQA
jgi:hypothetical protein